MLFKKRELIVLEMLENSKYIPAKTFCDALNITERTLRSDVLSLQNALTHHGATIIRKRKLGYTLSIEDPEAYKILKQIVSSSDRIGSKSDEDRFKQFLFILISSDSFIKIADIASAIYISESTSQAYLKRAKDVLGKYQLECVNSRGKGFKVIGTEKSKRNCLCNETTAYDGSLLNSASKSCPIQHDQIRSIIFKAISIDSHISMFGFNSIVSLVQIMLLRSLSGNTIEIQGDTYPSSISVEIGHLLEAELDHSIGLDEICWMSNSIDIHMRNIGKDTSISDYVNKLVQSIKHGYGYDFTNDFDFQSNLENHIKSVLKAEEFNIKTLNPLNKSIRSSFPLEYEMALMCVRDVFDENHVLNKNNNLDYIALHIAAGIEKQKGSRSRQYRVLVICNQGKTIETILINRLKNLFKASLDIREVFSLEGYYSHRIEEMGEFDLILTTVLIPDCPIPSITIDFDVNSSDIKRISKFIFENHQWMAKNIDLFMDEDSFIVFNQDCEKDGILSKLASLLLDQSIVPDSYLSSVLERESIADTVITPLVAIPHAMLPNARKTKVSVGLCPTPVTWTNETNEVRIVLMLAISNHDTAVTKDLHDLLVLIISNVDLQERLIQTSSFKEFKQILLDAINENQS